jgi:hypothetical protein
MEASRIILTVLLKVSSARSGQLNGSELVAVRIVNKSFNGVSISVQHTHGLQSG